MAKSYDQRIRDNVTDQIGDRRYLQIDDTPVSGPDGGDLSTFTRKPQAGQNRHINTKVSDDGNAGRGQAGQAKRDYSRDKKDRNYSN